MMPNITPMMVVSFCSGPFSDQGIPRLSQRAAACTVEVWWPEGRITLKIAELRLEFSSSASLMVA